MASLKTSETSEVVFTVKKGKQIVLDSFNSGPPESQDAADESVTTDEHKNILCVIAKNGKIGAAYYNFIDKTLYFFEELGDLGPQFLVTQSLVRQVEPKFVLSFGSNSDDFIKCLVNSMAPQDDSTSTSEDLPLLPQNIYLLSMKEYSLEICKLIVLNLPLISNVEESDSKRELHIHSLINFDYRLSVQSLGAVVKYLEKNWAFFDTNKESLQFVHVCQKSMKNHVLMDLTSFNALHIFQQRPHESGFKRGTQSANREGLSLFKLFSLHCKSKLGLYCLRNILMNPIKDMDELNKRLDFIGFSLLFENREFIEGLKDNIRYLNDINIILLRIHNGRANNRDWKSLYKTIFHTVFINELCTPFLGKSTLIDELNSNITSELIGLEQSMSKALDFSNDHRNRPNIKFGLDDTLDAKKLRKQDISKNVNAAARIVVEQLPDFIDECSVIYLPEMGHLIAIKEWEPDCNPEQLLEMGYQFVFKLSETLHFKNATCRELDKCYGDINTEIIDHENRIIRRLSGFILKYHENIRGPLRIIALIDCLLCMAKVAAEKNYVRPALNNEETFEIVEGRHPLMELLLTNYESNDFYSGNKHTRVKIITGPNGSGKSIYLKQVGLLLYMAHIGSYVPVKSANIGMIHSIHCRMQATESASVRLSAFMIDISQTTKAFNNAIGSSLVLIDEFGRGTSVDEGIAILVGTLKSFILKDQQCPHILASTHFQQIINHLPESNIVKHQKMEHTKEDGNLYFMYKVIDGVSNSFAFDIATAIGLDEDIITRARYIFNCLKHNIQIAPIDIDQPYLHLNSDNIDAFLSNVEIPEPDD